MPPRCKKRGPDFQKFKDYHYQIDSKVAAYLGYKDLGAFRTFRFSPIVRKWYITFCQTCLGEDNKTASDIDIALQLMLELEKEGFTDQQVDDMFPVDSFEIQYAYPLHQDNPTRATNRENAKQYHRRLANVLYRMAQDIEDAVQRDAARMMMWTDELESQWMALGLPFIPPLPMKVLESAALGPLNNGALVEPTTMPFERCWAVLKSLQRTLGQAVFKKQFIDHDDPTKMRTKLFKYQPIKECNIPAFMFPFLPSSHPLAVSNKQALQSMPPQKPLAASGLLAGVVNQLHMRNERAMRRMHNINTVQGGMPHENAGQEQLWYGNNLLNDPGVDLSWCQDDQYMLYEDDEYPVCDNRAYEVHDADGVWSCMPADLQDKKFESGELQLPAKAPKPRHWMTFL